MKNIISKLVLVLLVGFFCSCVSNYTPIIPDSIEKNESLLVFQRPKKFAGSLATVHVFINCWPRLSLKNGENDTIIVPNGTHLIELKGTSLYGHLEIFQVIEVNSEIITFSISAAPFSMKEKSRQKLIN